MGAPKVSSSLADHRMHAGQQQGATQHLASGATSASPNTAGQSSSTSWTSFAPGSVSSPHEAHSGAGQSQPIADFNRSQGRVKNDFVEVSASSPDLASGLAAGGTVEPTRPQIKVPLVFVNVEPTALGLTDKELVGINRLRSSFTAAVGVQNPADPHYADRWAEAQPSADDKLRAMLGIQRFNSYQLQASRLMAAH